MAAASAQNFPNVTAPFVDPTTGVLTNAAQRLLQTFWQRTGGAAGLDLEGATQLANLSLLTANALSEFRAAGTQSRARANLGLTNVATASAVGGWAQPTGAVSRAALNAGWSGAASASYTQAELQAVVTQVEALSGAVGALIEDLQSVGLLSFGS